MPFCTRLVTQCHYPSSVCFYQGLSGEPGARGAAGEPGAPVSTAREGLQREAGNLHFNIGTKTSRENTPFQIVCDNVTEMQSIWTLSSITIT